jgi:hypothetical protein
MARAQLVGVWSILAVCVACSSEGMLPPSTANGGTLSAAGATPAGGGGVPGSSAGAAGSASGGVSGTAQGGSNVAGGSGGGGASSGGQPAGGVSSGGNSTAGAGASAGGSAGAGGSSGSPALEPCSEPAVSRLKVWEMQVVGGSQVPANGSPLRKYDGGGYEMYVEWTLTDGGAYGTANAPLNNQGQYSNGADPTKNAVDISQGSGITLEYASAGSTYLQIRTATVPHGGDHFRADLPSTNGQLQTLKLDYASFRRPGGNTPPADDVLKDAFSFTFVGSATTKLTLRQVLIPGFKPPCN